MEVQLLSHGVRGSATFIKMPIKTKKAAFRKIFKAKRAELNAQLPNSGEILSQNFPQIDLAGKIISGYIPIQSEIDPQDLMKYLAQKGAKLCLPRINPITKVMNFHAFNFGETLEKGQMGLLEPSAQTPLLCPDIMLIPFLAFNLKGYRLGYGGGYYDKAIAKACENRQLITIGIGFDGQLQEDLPFEAHDKKLDYVLTEKQLYNF